MGLTSDPHGEVVHNTMYGRWFWYLLLSEKFVVVAGVKQVLADSFIGMGGWENLCKVQEAGLENFYSPFHSHLRCLGLSHVVLSRWAGLRVLAFSLSYAQSRLSACHLELLLPCMAIMEFSPWMFCSTTLWNADTGMENKNKNGIFQCILKAEFIGVLWVMRNSTFGDEIYI